MVDPKHINRPTKAYPQALSSPHSGNRCFPDWVGGVLSELRGVHGEHLDSGGSKAPYQLARIKRSISCPSMLCETPEQFPYFTPNGQPSGHNLYQQKGGHEIKSTLRPSSQGVDMMLGEVNYSGGETSPRPPKHSSGLREPSPDRLRRLAPEQSYLQDNDQSNGRLQY